MNRSLVPMLLLTVTCGRAAESPFDAAQTALANLKLAQARALLLEAQEKDSDPIRRDKAALSLANLDWRIRHDAAAADHDLALVDPKGEQAVNALVARARIELQLTRDVDAARRAAGRAVEIATRRDDRSRAIAMRARIEIDDARRARLAGRCTPAAPLRTAASDLRSLIDRDGPRHETTQLLLDASLMTGDTATALQAWRWYYGSAPAVEVSDRRQLGLALANAKLFSEAALILRDPCTTAPIAGDAAVADVLAYEKALRDIGEVTDEYYRNVALGKGDPRAFHKALDKIRLPELERRFGAVVTLGTTSNVQDIHYGHRVIDEQREVSQYGRHATLRFVVLDGIVSNGFFTWLRDGNGGDGGWASGGVVYQVRPMYADGPVMLWLRTADPELRAKEDREMADETKRDVERATEEPIRFFPGLAARLDREYADGVVAALRAKGLSGEALRDGFIARVRSDRFESSIWAHEGRHAIDQKEGIRTSTDLEFRAKLSEVALAPAPRFALTGGIIAGGIGSNTPHGQANKRVAEGLVKWMQEHAREIAGLNPSSPLLPQLDKLTDDQLRAAVRSMDPMADQDGLQPVVTSV